MRSAVPYDSGEFSPPLRPIAGHVDAATRVPSHPRMWLTYRTYVFGTVENNVEDTYVRAFPYTWGGGGGPTGLSVSLLFEKKRDASWTNFNVIHGTRYRDKGHFSSRTPLHVVRVTTVSLVWKFSVQSATISHRPLPRCNKSLHC